METKAALFSTLLALAYYVYHGVGIAALKVDK